MASEEKRRGAVVPLVGGPWDGQDMFVPTRPRMPDEITFPVQWHDGTWDNAHWQHIYRLRGVGHEGYASYTYEHCGTVPARGLNERERAEQEPQKADLLTDTRESEAT